MEYGLGLGSNLGDRQAWLARAAERVAALPSVRVIARSSIYETEPVDVQPEYRDCAFLNAVLIVVAPDAAEALAERLRVIETELGRVRQEDRNAPRVIDIDLIYADTLLVETAGLTLPHPRWAERRFVVQPLADIRPDLVLPGQTRTVSQILAALPPRPAAVRRGDFPG